MLRALVLVLAAACGAAPAPPATPAGSPALRLATWNVHDLFDEVDRRTPPGDADPVPSPAEVEAKLARVAGVLGEIGADVVVLQEVENLPLLERLAGADALRWLGYEAHLIEGHDPRGIDVGLLSRLSTRELRSHLADRAPDGTWLWARDLLEAHLAGAARPLVVLGAHFASRLDPSADARRAAQAARARELLDAARAAEAGAVVVLVGDLNDVPGSPSLAPLLADGALLDAGAALAPGGGWTWSGRAGEERIDYALLAREDAGLVSGVSVAAGPAVAGASDHRPVVLDLWLEAPR